MESLSAFTVALSAKPRRGSRTLALITVARYLNILARFNRSGLGSQYEGVPYGRQAWDAFAE